MSGTRTIGVGVIGLGFMGRTHLAAYESARRAGFDCRVVALADQDVGRLEQDADPQARPEVRTYQDPAALLADESVNLVSICTPTFTHVDLAISALRAGKHVLVEKPTAIRPADIERLIDVADEAETICMPAHCMRFWPGWAGLKGIIDGQVLGSPRSATFHRLSSPPDWSPDFYSNVERSGGALVDLHIHDADFVRWCFGDPVEVITAGTLNHLTTIYRLADGPRHVIAEGGWGHAPGFPFCMRYVLCCAQGTMDYDNTRDVPLRTTVDGACVSIDLPSLTGYDIEIRHLISVIQSAGRPRVTLEDALATARLLDAERKSLESGKPVRLHSPSR